MDRKAVIDKLVKCQHNPIKSAEALEKFADEGLTALEAHCTQQNAAFKALEEERDAAEDELKTLQEKVGTSDTTIKSLEGQLRAARKPLSEEDWMKQAPESIRGLVERQKKLDDEKKIELIETLKTAQQEFSEDELKAMELSGLERTARMLKLDQPVTGDFSAARRVPRAAAAREDDPHANPPDAYAVGVERLRKMYER